MCDLPNCLLSSETLKPVIPITFTGCVFPSAPGWPWLRVLQPVHLGDWGDYLLLPAQSLDFQGSDLMKVEVDFWAVDQGLEHLLDLAAGFGSPLF